MVDTTKITDVPEPETGTSPVPVQPVHTYRTPFTSSAGLTTVLVIVSPACTWFVPYPSGIGEPCAPGCPPMTSASELLANPAPFPRVYLTQSEVHATICSMVKRSRRVTLSNQVRAAVDASPFSRYQICKETDIAQSAMSRFMSGQGGLSMAAFDRLGEVLGLKIIAGHRRRKGS